MDKELLKRTIEILEERHGDDFTNTLLKKNEQDEYFFLREVIKATMNAHYNLSFKSLNFPKD